jgi:hypothetical protein
MTKHPKTRKGKLYKVVNVTEDVDDGDGPRDVEAIDIKLSRLAGALKIVTVHITDDGVGMFKNWETSPTHINKKN